MSAVIDYRGSCRDLMDCQKGWCALEAASALAWPYQALASILGRCATSMVRVAHDIGLHNNNGIYSFRITRRRHDMLVRDCLPDKEEI
jgi:hypothetical protein